jgi:hypothetical protein
MRSFPNKLKALNAKLQSKFELLRSNTSKYAIMTLVVCLCLIIIAPWLIMIKYSIWDIPVKEDFNTLGNGVLR